MLAGVNELPKVSLAVLAESLRAILLCLHAGQDRVLVNGEEASSTAAGREDRVCAGGCCSSPLSLFPPGANRQANNNLIPSKHISRALAHVAMVR